jgi:two-component system chemotaxis response regulator CheY
MQAAAPAPVARPSSPVLLADGCAYGRRQSRKVLADLGYRQIYEAADGAEAVGILGTLRPALAVLDWHLKVIGPSDVLQILREGDGAGEATPVLVTMSTPSRMAVEKAVSLGVGQIVAKPFSDRIMRSRLARLAGS